MGLIAEESRDELFRATKKNPVEAYTWKIPKWEGRRGKKISQNAFSESKAVSVSASEDV